MSASRTPAGAIRSRGSALGPQAITAHDAQASGALPLHHRDPFDRLLIAQAQLERCAIVSGDGAFAAYEAPVVW